MNYKKMTKADLIKELEAKPKTEISNNTFTGVKWDAEAIESVDIVARALLNLTEVFKAQGVKIDMLKVNTEKII